MTLEQKLKYGMVAGFLIASITLSCNERKSLHVPQGKEFLMRESKAFGIEQVNHCYRGPLDVLCYLPCTKMDEADITPQLYQQDISLPPIIINSKKMQVNYQTALTVEPTPCSIEILLRDYQGNRWLETLQTRMGPSIEKIIQRYEETGQTHDPAEYLAAHLPDGWSIYLF